MQHQPPPPPPHHHHHNHGRFGEERIGKPDDIFKNFLIDPEEFIWTIEKIINEGPPPKQYRSAILLKVLGEVIKKVSDLKDKGPMPVIGFEIRTDSPEDGDYILPVQIPKELLKGINGTDDLIDWIGEGPLHDVLRDILMMVAIFWIKESLDCIKPQSNEN